MKARLTPEELARAHDGMCGVSIGDGECSCLVHWIEGLQKDLDAKELQLSDLQKEVKAFLYKADFTPPWESAGAVWGQMCVQLKKALEASKTEKPKCDHQWIDARNQIVKSGELCLKCFAIRAGNQAPERPFSAAELQAFKESPHKGPNDPWPTEKPLNVIAMPCGCDSDGGKCSSHTEKQICEHKWAHIEDYHVICEKCKHTADLCQTCGFEKTKTRDGGLVCLKCNPQ